MNRDELTEQRIQAVFATHPHFRGRNLSVDCRCSGRCVQLSGMLPSYYLKQIAQEALRDLAGVDEIKNEIIVVNTLGSTEFTGD